MTIKSKFCASCGKESKKALCAKCYLAEHKIKVPKSASLLTCSKCGAVKWRGVWIKPEQDVEEYFKYFVIDNTKLPENIELEDVKINTVAGTITLDLSVFGEKFTEIRHADFKLKKFACPDCSRQFGGAWTAKVQARTKKREEVDKVLGLARKFSSKIVKTEEQKNGIDIYFFDKSAASRLASLIRSKLNLKISKTTEHFRMKEGKAVYRDVILLKE